MKLTKSYLRKIISEETDATISEISRKEKERYGQYKPLPRGAARGIDPGKYDDPDINVSDRKTQSLTRKDVPDILAAIHSFLSDSKQAPPSLGFIAPAGEQEEAFIEYYQRHPDKLKDFIDQTRVIDVEAGPDDDLANTMQDSLYPAINDLGFYEAPRVVRSVLKYIEGKLKPQELQETRMTVKAAVQDIADRFGGEALRGLPRAGQRSGTSDDYQYTIRNKVIFSHDTRGPEGETPDQKQERLKEDEELGILARDEAFDALMSEGEPVEEDSYVKRPMILWNGLMLKKMTHSFSHNPGTWLYPAIGVATTKAKSVKAKK